SLRSICLLASFAFALAVYGQGNKTQTKPDFSGIWVLDPGQSNVSQSLLSKPEQIKITQHDPELTIIRTITISGTPEERQFAYYTDGRGETNPATTWLSTSPNAKAPHPSETKSKTRWSGNRLATRWTLRVNAGSHIISEDVVDEWQMSA